MKRRQFIQAFAGAVASVAIGMKLSQGMPEIPLPPEGFRYVDPDLQFKATERFSEFNFADWRCVYGSPG